MSYITDILWENILKLLLNIPKFDRWSICVCLECHSLKPGIIFELLVKVLRNKTTTILKVLKVQENGC